MSNRTTIYIRVYPAAGRPGFFDAYDGKRHLCRSRTPFVSSARQLLGARKHPDTLLIMRHGDSEKNAMIGLLGSLAKVDVREDAKSGPRFVRHRPNPFATERQKGSGPEVTHEASA